MFFSSFIFSSYISDLLDLFLTYGNFSQNSMCALSEFIKLSLTKSKCAAEFSIVVAV